MLAGSAFMSFVMGIVNAMKSNKIDRNVSGSVPTAINTLNDVVGAINKKMDDLTEQSRATTVRQFAERLDRIESTQAQIIQLLEIVSAQHGIPPITSEHS